MRLRIKDCIFYVVVAGDWIDDWIRILARRHTKMTQ